MKKFSPILVCVWGNVIIAVAVAFWLGLYPAWISVGCLLDPALHDGGVVRYAFDMHRSLSPKIARWAEERLQRDRPAQLTRTDISGNEWPLFGSVFYLWATEGLQDAWERAPEPVSVAPNVYARDAIAASVRLVLDPKHATWVRRMWGEHYLGRHNCFYRFLRIAAMTAQVRLLADTSILPQLREEVDHLAAEIDGSRAGLIEDYPGECYPGDVAAALACIRRADAVLGTDHGDMLRRAYRGFDETKTDGLYGLPPYAAAVHTGFITDGARGCSNAYYCMTGPELWPEAAANWYANYDKHFWQESLLFAGFREFPRGSKDRDWYLDVDAGPCAAGYGAAASAFGLAAARINGRFDHAYPLAAQMITLSWPMPNGRLVFPAMFSNVTDAPFLGEQCILYTLSRTVQPGVPITAGGRLPGIVILIIFLYLSCSALLVLVSVRGARLAAKRPARVPALQTAAWGAATLASLAFFLSGMMLPALYCLAISQAFPMRLWRRSARGTAPALSRPLENPE